MTNIYIVRHGETDLNVAYRYIGSTDQPLNERGCRQAACLRKPFSKIHLDTIYASPLQRTMMTAEQVKGDKDIPIITISDLREIQCGDWETLNREEIEAKWPGMINLWQFEPEKLKMPGKDGESFVEVQKRSYAAFIDLVRTNEGRDIAVVSHMLPIKLVIAKLFGIPIHDIWRMSQLENTSITHLSFLDAHRFRILSWGLDSHLTPDLKNADVKIAGFTDNGSVLYDMNHMAGVHFVE